MIDIILYVYFEAEGNYIKYLLMPTGGASQLNAQFQSQLAFALVPFFSSQLTRQRRTINLPPSYVVLLHRNTALNFGSICSSGVPLGDRNSELAL